MSQAIEEIQAENAHLQRRVAELEQQLDAAETQRLQMEHELQTSQERLQLVIEATRDGIWDWHIPSGEVYYSPRWLTMLGYAPGELPYTLQTWENLLHPDDTSHTIEVINMHMQQQSASYEVEFRMRTKDNEWRWILARGKIVERNEQGQPVRMLGTHTDITKRKKAEEELRQSKTLIQSVFDHMPMAIYVRDVDGRFILVNKNHATALGYTSQQLVGRYDYELFSPEMMQAIRALDQQVMENGTFVQEEEIVPLELGGGTFLSSRFPLFDEHGNVYGIGGISTDITERKHAEQELRIFQSIVENSPDGVCVVHPDDYHIFYANHAYRTLVQYGDEVIGMHGALMLDIDQEQFDAIGCELVERGAWQGVLPCKRKDGGIVYTSQSVFPIADEKNNVHALAVIAHDLTEQQRQEAERTTLQQQVIEAQRAALRELSAPLLPISAHTVIMPLIGTIDSQRAQQIMETLLHGVADHHADIAIVDITGVQVVDTQVASALIQAAQAVQLLGAQVVLTGIGPSMAQTLVSLGVDLSGIVTRGSLQKGMAYAIGMNG